MLELLQKYSLTEIITFIVLLALAIKGIITFWDWAVDRLKKAFKEENDIVQDRQRLDEHIEESSKRMGDITKQQNKMMEEILRLKTAINLLVDSDKDDIKSWITAQHHHFCYDLKYIDDYSLDCIERRYSHYKDEGGNSFIGDLMKELRELPKVSVISQLEEYKDNNDENQQK